MWNKIKNVKFTIPTKHDLLHSSYKGGHTTYFLAVFIEGHGFYALTGGFLFALCILDFFIHFE